MEHPTGLAVTEHIPESTGGDSPLVVLVHGSLDRATSFNRVLRRLTDLHTVAYDRRGYHRSRHSLPLATTLDSQIDDLLGVIGGRPATVIGHSYGGTVALGAALRHDPVSTITSVAAYEPPLPWMDFWSSRGTTARRGSLGDDPGVAAEQFFRRIVGTEAWDRLPDATKSERRADGQALIAELNAIRLEEAPFDVTTMRIPALYGRGEHSMDHHLQGVAWLAEHTPGGELVEIPGASHGAHLTHPDAFADFVRRAVGRAQLPARSHR
jgi:pimeloyl-ACP methyl ester carboxylesterase